MERNEECMLEKIKELWRKKYKIEDQIVSEKIKMILQLAREGKEIPYFLNFDDNETNILRDKLEGKALEKGKNLKEYYLAESGYTLIKIGDIELCLNEQGSYYATKETFENLCETIKAEGGSIDDLPYMILPALKEDELLNWINGDNERQAENQDEQGKKQNLPAKTEGKITLSTLKKVVAKFLGKGER